MRISSRSLAVVVALVVALVACARTARAQGLPEPRFGAAVGEAQAAAVNDNTALLTNPAGLSGVRGVELGFGWFTRAQGAGQEALLTQTGDATLVLGGGLGALAAGVGTQVSPGSAARLRWSAGGSLRLDDATALGVAAHSVDRADGVGHGVLWDVGTQLRLARFFAIAVVGENLGNDVTPGALRLGASVRPLDELLTFGIDARMTPAIASDLGTSLAKASWTPAANLRVQLGGFGVFGGVSIDNLVSVPAGPVVVEALGGVQIDLEHAGIVAIGGAGGVGSDIDAAGGARARLSTERWASVMPDAGRWLRLELGADAEPVRRHQSVWSALFADGPSSTAVLLALDRAARDASVEGIVLSLQALDIGWGRAGELRAALVRLREAGKKVVVHFDVASDVEAFIASAADKVWMTPSGSLAVDGVRAEMVYVGEALKRLGIHAEAVAAGRYKSAPRAFTHDAPSPEELEVESAILDGVYAALVDALARGRALSADAVKAAIDLGGMSPAEALDQRFVDALVYVDELPEKVAELAGHPGFRMPLERGWLEPSTKQKRWGQPIQVALIPVQGDIKMGGSGGGLFGGGGAGSDDVVEAIEAAAEDPAIAAIVLRIDSPGGDALASDLIWRAVMLAREKKPVVASMGDVAASGGYYVASAAHEILAEPNTITGSIGVFGLLLDAERLANDLGVRSVEMKRGANPGATLLRPMTDDERARTQASVDAVYEQFLEAVVAGRGKERIEKEALRAIAEGRVWTGAQAVERKLVDAEGSIVDALTRARARAAIADDEPVELVVLTGTEGEVGSVGGVHAVARVVGEVLGLDARSALARAVKLVVGDPDLVALAVDSEGRPLAHGPGFTVR